MQVSLRPRMELRSKIGRIAAAVGFALVICSFAGPVRADGDHRGGDRDRGGDQHRDNDNHGYRGGNNYYAPQPNYYAAPDPYYYGSDRSYSAPPPGVSLFFGL